MPPPPPPPPKPPMPMPLPCIPMPCGPKSPFMYIDGSMPGMPVGVKWAITRIEAIRHVRGTLATLGIRPLVTLLCFFFSLVSLRCFIAGFLGFGSLLFLAIPILVGLLRDSIFLEIDIRTMRRHGTDSLLSASPAGGLSPDPASSGTGATAACSVTCKASAPAPGFASTGVGGADSPASLGFEASRFFSSVLTKTLIVVRKDFIGLQSSAESGECSQTGHDVGSVAWPVCRTAGQFCLQNDGLAVPARPWGANLQFSQIAWSQHGSFTALIASLLQMAQRSLMGISSWVRELQTDMSVG
ncbi:hypothetical protein PoMZ_08434 [Pyricularia oryzae]|uniref:Uncharacterized protein n=1 Tax=Pyricularia oryzae TaxID=318829 RepID=A0A4P7NHM0_PYROR|nr:hypothetical protein PoMZ_08434 [Pyricularia oryzae]